jgi:poly(A) polymerase Pap1
MKTRKCKCKNPVPDNEYSDMCGNSGIDNKDHYVVTTELLKADEVPEKCMDAKSFAELVAKLLNRHYNK